MKYHIIDYSGVTLLYLVDFAATNHSTCIISTIIYLLCFILYTSIY